MNPMLIDTHCHLDMEVFDGDREEVVKRANEANIKYIVNVGSDREGNIKGLKLSSEYPHVYSAVGIHPHDAKTLDGSLLKEVKRWIQQPKVIAVGEIGLDYHYVNSPKGVQIEVFRQQIALAKDSNLPIIVHSREAKNDTLRILREDGTDTPGVLHCFSGDVDMAEKAMELGFYISIAGPVTFKNAKKLREIAKIIPEEFLLVETDAPYLSPVPMRGKRNEPSFLRHIAWVISDIRGISIYDLSRITTLNAMRLFKIREISESGEITYKIRDSLYLNITNRCTNKCGFCIRFRTSYVKGHNLRLEKEPSALQTIKAINTNGHGNLIHGKNILPELHGIVDSLSISLDAENEGKYEKICKPTIKDAFKGVISFIKEAKKFVPEVKLTVVKIPEIDIDKCKAVAEDLGVELRVRKFNMVG